MTITVPHVTPVDCDIRIGRAAAMTGSEWGPISWDQSGETVRISGAIFCPNIGDAKMLRQQLNGHKNSGEIVPVVWDADETVNGYYRVRNAEVSMRGPSLYHGIWQLDLELEQVRPYAMPYFSSKLIGGTITNGLGISGAPWHASPQSNNLDDAYDSSIIAATYGRTTVDGAIPLVFLSTANPSAQQIPRWHTPPERWYRGAATIEVSTPGAADWRPVAGLQVENAGPTNEHNNIWRLNNGLLLAGWVEGSTTNFYVQHYDGTQFEAAKEYTITAVSAFTLLNPSAVLVIRNTPEMVIVRTVHGQNHGNRITIDWTLRRGDRWVRAFLRSRVAETWKVTRGTIEAGTGITGGIRAASNDGGGNRYMIASPTMTTKDEANGGIQLPSAAVSAEFGVGMNIGGSGASTPEQPTGSNELIEQYFASQIERVSVAGK